MEREEGTCIVCRIKDFVRFRGMSQNASRRHTIRARIVDRAASFCTRCMLSNKRNIQHSTFALFLTSATK
jgi:hypothetical protein